jgi:hypothetical protein
MRTDGIIEHFRGFDQKSRLDAKTEAPLAR